MRALAVLVALLAVSTAACGDGDDGDPAEPQPTVTVTVTETETVMPSEPEETPSPTETPDAAGGDPCAEIEPIGAQLAFIVVSSPNPGEVLESGGTVEGCGNTFEAAYQWELLDSQGNPLGGEPGTMSCGNGCHGDFTFQVEYEVGEEQIGTLRVFETSAEDGSDVHVNSIPVRLQP